MGSRRRSQPLPERTAMTNARKRKRGLLSGKPLWREMVVDVESADRVTLQMSITYDSVLWEATTVREIARACVESATRLSTHTDSPLVATLTSD